MNGKADAPVARANPLLLGQASAEQTLLTAWRSGRLPHGWVIGGPRGIGKATLAYRFARFVLAGGGAGELLTDPDSLAIAADHPVFRRVAAGGHADLLTVERQPAPSDRRNGETKKLRSEIVVEDVREVASFLRLTPAEGDWRVVVIDCADEMNRNAANALLKILEEPPRQALLLLVSHVPGRLLPTIRSRCRSLMLQGLDPATMTALVSRYCDGLPEPEQGTLIALADGSIGRALELVEAGGLDLYRRLCALLDSLPRLDLVQLQALSDEIGRADDDAPFRTVIDLLQAWIRRLVRIAGGVPDAKEGLASDVRTGLSRLAAPATLDRWLAVWDKIGRLAGGTAWANLDRRQVLVDALLAIEAAAAGRPTPAI